MATQTEIINYALRRLGCEPVDSIEDSNKRAMVMKDIYTMARRDALEQFPWPFAIRRITLTASTVVFPTFGYTYYFELPEGYITAIDEYDGNEYVREGIYLASDSNTLNIRYIYDEKNTKHYSATFSKVLSLVLAKEGTYALNQDKGLKQELEEEKIRVLEDARYSSSKESSAVSLDIDDFLTVRY